MTGKDNKNKLWHQALQVVKTLQDAGFSAYFAGGCVRDMLLGKDSDDIDIATSAKTSEILALFPHCHEIGAAFGIINVVMDEHCFEVATFREERDYSDGRHPEEIRYTDDPELDARRRDFTINAMFFDPVNETLLDFANGQDDLRKRILKTVGDPEMRFAEDYLRILRAVCFAIRFEMELSADIPIAIRDNLAGLQKLSVERIREELNKMLTGKHPDRALQMLADLGILEKILPEVLAMQGVEQPKEFHPEGDVFVHTVLMLRHMTCPSVELAWSILLHDVGKPSTFSIGEDGVEHFYCHEHESARMAEDILQRFKFSRKEITNIVESVGNHMRFAHVSEMRQAKLKRLIASETFPLQLELHRIDCISSHAKMDQYIFLLDKLGEEEDVVALPKPLINGHDLMELGIPGGPIMGEILNRIADMQMEGELTTKEDAIAKAKEFYHEGTKTQS